MADERTPLAFSYYRVGHEYFKAIRKHSISPTPRKIRGRSAEDPRGSQGSEGTGWAPSSGFPIQGPEGTGRGYRFLILPAPRKIRGRSAEDPRKTPAEVLDPEAHRATGVQILATGLRGRSAEDTGEVIWRHRLNFELWGLSSTTVGSRWLHWVAGYRMATGWWATRGHRVATNPTPQGGLFG